MQKQGEHLELVRVRQKEMALGASWEISVWSSGNSGGYRCPAARAGPLTSCHASKQVTEKAGAELGDCTWNFLTWMRFGL